MMIFERATSSAELLKRRYAKNGFVYYDTVEHSRVGRR